MHASWTRSRTALGRLAAPFGLFAALVTGCAGGPPPAIPPGAFEPLADDEGYFVVQVDSDLGIERLQTGTRVVASQLPPGRHLWLIRMKEGRERWTAVKLQLQAGNDRAIRPAAAGAFNEREFEFDVKAGAVNYPGELVVRMAEPEHGIGSGVSVRNRNHSAMAIRSLVKSHSALLAAHPIRYAGSSGDEFLQFYTRERDRLSASGSGTPSASGGSE